MDCLPPCLEGCDRLLQSLGAVWPPPRKSRRCCALAFSHLTFAPANCANVGRSFAWRPTLRNGHGNLCPREEPRQKICPADTFVDFDHSLHNAIARIRETLG